LESCKDDEDRDKIKAEIKGPSTLLRNNERTFKYEQKELKRKEYKLQLLGKLE